MLVFVAVYRTKEPRIMVKIVVFSSTIFVIRGLQYNTRTI